MCLSNHIKENQKNHRLIKGKHTQTIIRLWHCWFPWSLGSLLFGILQVPVVVVPIVLFRWCGSQWSWPWCWGSVIWSVVRVWRSSSDVLSVWMSSMSHWCYSVDTPTAGEINRTRMSWKLLSCSVVTYPILTCTGVVFAPCRWMSSASCSVLCAAVQWTETVLLPMSAWLESLRLCR